MKPRILLIEDDDVLNQLLSGQLERFGYAVQGMRTWRSAASYMEEHEPDLVILDCRLPDADGMELLPKLSQSVPVVILTAYASVQNAVRAIKYGAAEYLVKPVNLDELEVVVQRALENAALRKENQFLKSRMMGQVTNPLT
ncbi:MAG: response regulator, partial [Rhodospirillales bacterium]|nr:response regulator [Rhodospirillales bacterium]